MREDERVEIAEFLLARIAEDEAGAREAQGIGDDGMCWYCGTRVLAECEAKRLLVGLHRPGEWGYPGEHDLVCMSCSAGGEYSPSQFDGPGEYHDWPCPTL